MIFVGRDDDGGDFRPFHQLFEVGGEEVGVGVLGKFFAEVFLDIAQAEPADAGVIAGDLGADTPNRPTADYRQPNFITFTCQRVPTVPLVCCVCRLSSTVSP
jgi:hypothetical protein